MGLIAIEGMKRMRKALKNVMCPALLVQGSVDQSISKNSASRIYNMISSENKEIWIIEGADHPIMNELEYKDELFARTISFLENNV